MIRSTTFNNSHGGNRSGHRLGVFWLLGWFVLAGFFFARGFSGYAAGALSRGRNEQLDVATATSVAPASHGRTKNIEDIRVGERVALAENPAEPFDNSLGDVVPTNWRKIELRPDEHSSVVLLRPQWWIDQRLDTSRKTLTISVPEVGLDGGAEVLTIGPCPPIKPGSGSVVIGTFAHAADATIELHLDGLTEPIGCTPDHPTWSMDRQKFIAAQELQHGELVQGIAGPLHVVKIVHRAERIRVFNLEIHGQHVYQVSAQGVLVHNAPSSPGKMNLEVRRGQAPKEVERVDPGHLEGQEPHVHYRDGTSSTRSGGVHDASNGYPNPSNKTRQWLQSHEWTPPPRPTLRT